MTTVYVDLVYEIILINISIPILTTKTSLGYSYGRKIERKIRLLLKKLKRLGKKTPGIDTGTEKLRTRPDLKREKLRNWKTKKKNRRRNETQGTF